MRRRLFWTLLLLVGVCSSALAQNITVSGTVKDDTGEPLFGVFVQIKGTSKGAVTDDKGHYSVAANVGDVLHFSFLGMKSQDKKVTQGMSTLNITLKDDVQEIEGTVVMGYGAKKVASKTVGLAATVQGADIKETPTINIADALQGKVAGAVITTNSGDPEAESQITIHGFNSFAAGDKVRSTDGDPLFVVDGVAVSRAVFKSLNPNDIESISVLKDAASTSIYGTRAANGVIYITTKRGKKDERTSLSISQQVSFSRFARTKIFDDLMTTDEYLDFWLKTQLDNRVTPALVTQIKEESPYNTDWKKLFYRGFAPTYRTNVSLSGGSNQTTYFVSASYSDQTGLRYGSRYQRYTLNANVDTEVNKWLKMGISLSVGHSESDTNGAGGGDSNGSLFTLPFYSPRDENGKLKDYVLYKYSSTPNSGFYMPAYNVVKNPRYAEGEDILPIGYITIEPIKNLVLKTQAGIQYGVNESEQKTLPSFVLIQTGQPVGSTSYTRRGSTKKINNTFTNTMEYRFNLQNKHYFTALMGQESVRQMIKWFDAVRYGMPLDELSMLSNGTRSFGTPVNDSKSVRTFNSLFGRIEYEYNNKYFLDISGRRDGSSIFGRNNRYANFWAIGGMWKISSEPFLKDVKWLTNLSLRASTGLSGNPAGGDYAHLTIVNTAIYNGGTSYSILSSAIGNPDLAWEKQQKTTIGLSGRLFDNTSFSIEYYSRITRGMLLASYINSMSGASANFTDNAGDFENRGFDLTINSTVYQNREHNVSIRPYLNLNYNDQRVRALADGKDQLVGVNSGNYAYQTGSPVYWALPIFKGINPDNGHPEWYLPNTDRMDTRTDDNAVTDKYGNNGTALIQNTGKRKAAPLNGGFGLNVTYEGFTLDMGFAFTYGKYMLNLDRRAMENPGSFGINNLSRKALDYWTPENRNSRQPLIDRANYPRFVEQDTRILEDASFIRMKNLSLSYRFSKETIDKIKFFNGIRIYGSARNLWTITKYTGADPEYPNSIAGGGTPPTREYTFGVEVKF